MALIPASYRTADQRQTDRLHIEGFREIPLTQGRVTLVDEADYERISACNWHYHHGHVWGYPYGRNYHIPLHRFLLNPPAHLFVDHINGDGLDNRRANLRIANKSQNNANNFNRKRGKSGFKGVYRQSPGPNWRVQIGNGAGGAIYLGSFNDPVEAARAYDRAARQIFGQFARLNFPEES